MDIRWNMQGFRDLRTDPAVMAKLNEEAERIAATASESAQGFEVQPAYVTGGRVRGRAAVITTTYAAMKAEAEDHVLLRALGGQGLTVYVSKAGKASLITQKQHDNYTRKRKG